MEPGLIVGLISTLISSAVGVYAIVRAERAKAITTAVEVKSLEMTYFQTQVENERARADRLQRELDDCRAERRKGRGHA